MRVLADGKETACDRGEVQFTRNGISGIPVFQVSRHAVRALDEGRKVEVSLNLLPQIPAEAADCQRRKKRKRPRWRLF